MSYGDSEASTYEGPMRDGDEREMKAAKLRDRDRAPVERELDRTAEAISTLDEAIGELHRRLEPILGPERPEPALGEVRQHEDLSPVANRLMEDGDRILNLNRAIRSILRRIEL